jgi:aminomethyltransferase
MRISPLHDALSARGAQFGERYGKEVALSVAGSSSEYQFVRAAAGVTDASYLQLFRFPEATGVDFLDRLLPGNVAKIRFGRALHTFLPDDDGCILADLLVANNDEELIVVCEGIATDEVIREQFLRLGALEAGMEDLTETHAAISVDGYSAWDAMRKIAGPEVLGLPYLSIDTYEYEDADFRVVRAGKTSEFGYLVLAERQRATALFEQLVTAVGPAGGVCGVAVHDDLRLEGRFLNVFREGAAVRDPLPLGLQWMIDVDKESFQGSTALFARRKAGLQRKIIGLAMPAALPAPRPGTPLFDDGQQIGELITVCFSPTAASWLALALLPVEIAFAGLSFHLGDGNGPVVTSISMPPIVPKSLSVRLEEM